MRLIDMKYPKTKLTRQAIKIWVRSSNPFNDPKVKRKALARKWINAVNYMGPKWIMSDVNQVQRKV